MMQNNAHLYLSYTLINSPLIPKFVSPLVEKGFTLSWNALKLPQSKISSSSPFGEIKQSSLFIAFIDDTYFNSKYTSNEFSFALSKNIPILPILFSKNTTAYHQLEQCLPAFNDFAEEVSTLISENDPRLHELIDIIIHTHHIIPRENSDWRPVYLTRLIAHIESSKALLNWIRLAETQNANFRPQHHFIQRWQTPGLFYVESDRIHKDMRDVIQLHTQIHLQGSLGSGKTSTLHSLLLEIAILYMTHRGDVPFPVYLELNSGILWDDLEDHFAREWHIPKQAIREVFDNPTFIFVDDPNNILSNPHYSQKLSAWLKTLPPNTQFIIASEAPPFSDEIIHVRINSFIDSHITTFLNTYLTKTLSDQLTEKFSTINLELQENGFRVYELAKSPFFLTLFAVIQSNVDAIDKTLPFQSGQLIAKTISPVYKKFRLTNLAHKEMQSFLGLIARQIILNYPQNGFPLTSLQEVTDSQPHWTLIQSLGLLNIHNGQLYFPHVYILCFFACFKMTDEEVSHTLCNQDNEETQQFIWETVARFKAQLNLLKINQLPKIGEVNPLFAIELYAEMDQDDIKIHHYLVEQLIDHCSFNPDAIPSVTDVLKHNHPNQSRDILLEVARHDTWEHRKTAVKIVRQLVTSSTGGLREALSDLPLNTEINIPHVLKRIGNANLLPELMSLFHDLDWNIRQSVAFILGNLGDTAGIPSLVESLQDQKAEVILESINALEHLKDPHAIPWLTSLFPHNNEAIREKTGQTVASFGEVALDTVIPLINSTNTLVKISAIKTLAQIKHERTLEPLLNASYDEDVEIRYTALQALGNQEDIMAINRLIESLADNSKLHGAKRRISSVATDILRSLGYLAEASHTIDDIEINPSNYAVAKPRSSKKRKKTASSGKERLKRITQETSSIQQGNQKKLSNDYLNDPDRQVRAEFVRQIKVDTHAENTIPLLKRALQDEDTHVRVAAIDKLAELNVDQAVGGLLYAMQDRDYAVSDAAAQMLQKMGKRAIPGLMKLLSSKNVNIRGMAIESMGEIGDPVVAPTLIKLLHDEEIPWLSSERICDITARALTKINSSEARRAVTQWKKQELQDHAQRHHMDVQKPKYTSNVEIQASDHKQIITELINELRNNEWEQQVNAAKALSEYARAMHGTSQESLLKTLVDTLEDDNWVVRWATIEALAWIGNSTIIPQLAPLANDENWIIRVAVIRALQEIGDPQSTAIICKLAQDDNDVVRETSAEVLGLFTENPEIDTLRQLSRDENEFVRQAAIQSLGDLKIPDTIDALKQVLQDDSDYVRWVAIRSLSQWHHKELVSIFISQLDDTFIPHLEKKRICDFALEALTMIDDIEARLAVETWKPRLRELDDAHKQ